MNASKKNIIAKLLAVLILLINIAELGAFIHHWEAHQILQHDQESEDHENCNTFHAHINLQQTHQICDGHFLNFMPQIVFKKTALISFEKSELIIKKAIFFRVKQYSSSYTHLFTSRPPPNQV